MRASRVVATTVGWTVAGIIAAGQVSAPRPAMPADPVSAIVEAFRTHPIVALGEGAHGNEQAHAFRMALIRDSRFSSVADDIVVESGNSRYQELIDRFATGEEVPSESLRRVWQDTTQPHTLWDVPIYEEFLRAVQAVNRARPAGQRMRILLGDPPIDWESIDSIGDLQRWQQTPAADRDAYPADLIRREVLTKGRRALLIYGDMHFNRRNPNVKDGPDAGSKNIVDLLERNGGTRIFTIHTQTFRVDLRAVQADVASWPRPSLAVLRGTVLGAADFTTYFPAANLMTADRRPINPRPMEDQFDAVLYLGPPSEITMSRLPPALCADSAYLTMRIRHMRLAGLTRAIDELNRYCSPASK
jgi:hypothetical protein